MNPKTQFIAVFDADFIPPPDILHQFISYFYGINGNGNGNGNGSNGNGNGHNGNGLTLVDEKLAVVQGYQWHVLNASENWITRGIRAEFSGSYVVERSSQELTGAMKMISGSVFMIRADVLREHEWGTSITEDWELTLRLYLNGYKVLYSPFIQAPAEIVSDFKQLTRQRMRWAEGHTYNVKKYFFDVFQSPHLSIREKFEFAYYAPYYLTSALFVIGTAAWLFSELFMKYSLPFWSALLGWSLVFTNSMSLVLMNLVGLFQERSVRRNWQGLLSFVLLTFLLVPYQAYAAIKGLLQPREGGWHRTRKSGVITETVDRMQLKKRMKVLLPKKKKVPKKRGVAHAFISRLPEPIRRASNGRNFRIAIWVAIVIGIFSLLVRGAGMTQGPPVALFGLAIAISIPVAVAVLTQHRRGIALRVGGVLFSFLVALGMMANQIIPVSAAPDAFYLHDTNTTGITPSGKYMNTTLGAGAATMAFNTVGQDAYWYSDITYPDGADDASIASGDYTLNMYFSSLPSAGATATTGTCTIADTASSGSCTISPTLTDTTKTILLFQATSSNNTPSSSSVRCYLTSTSNITCDRDGTSGLVNIAWQTAEFSSGVTVEHLTPVCNEDGDGDEDITNVVITAVSDMAKTFLLYSHKTSGATHDRDDPRTVRLTSTTNVEIRQDGNGACAAGSEGALQVVQYDGASVTRGETAAMTGTSLSATGLSSVTTANTMLLYSYRAAGSGPDMCERMVRGEIDSATSLNFTRSDGAGGCDTANIVAIAWERVEFTDGTSVQQVEPAMTGVITVESTVSQSSDDAEESQTGSVDLTSSDLELAVESNPQTIGIRFQGISVPQGATITNAYVQFAADNVSRSIDPIDLTIQGELSPSAATFLAVTNNITVGRPLTSASVNWIPPVWVTNGDRLAAQQTPDLKAIIQEVVDQGGWGNGNPLVIIVTGSGRREAESWDGADGHGDPTLAALLHIEYAGGTSTANVTISSVDTSRTIVFAGGQHTAGQSHGEGTYKGDDVIGAMIGRHTLTSSTNLQVVRDDTSGHARWTSYVVEFPVSGSVDIVVTVSHTAADGSGATTIVSSSTTTIDSSSANPLALNVGNDPAGQTFTSADPRRLRAHIEVTGLTGGGTFTLAYDSVADPSNLETPSIIVPEWGLAFLLLAPLIPYLLAAIWRRKRLAGKMASVMVALIVVVGLLARTADPVFAAPDSFYFHNTATSGITPAGEYMDNTEGTGGSTVLFDTVNQDEYWYHDVTWPTGTDDATIAAGSYTANLYFAGLPAVTSIQAGTPSSAPYGPVSQMEFSHTTPAGDGGLLMVGVSLNNDVGETVSAVRYNGDPLTFFDAVNSADDARTEIWYRLAPDVGTFNMLVRFSTWPDPIVRGGVAGALSFTGVDQTTPLGLFFSDFGQNDPGPLEVDVTSAVGEVVFATASCEQCGPLLPDGSMTERWNDDYNSREYGAGATKAGATTTTMSWALTSADHWSIGAVPIKPAGIPSVDITASVHHTASDGSGATLITSASTTIDSTTADPLALDLGSPLQQTFTSADPRRLRLHITIDAVNSGGSFTMDYDGACTSNLCSNLDTPVIVVPEYALAFIPVVLLIPLVIPYVRKRRKKSGPIKPDSESEAKGRNVMHRMQRILDPSHETQRKGN